jgi:hypothetical protein
MADKKIKCVSDLIKHLKTNSSKNGVLWYRGHSDLSWKLERA